MSALNDFSICILVIFLVYLWFSCFILCKTGQTIVVERLGRFSRILAQGPNFVWPFIENLRSVNWSYTEENPRTKEIFKRSFTDYRIDNRERIFDPPSFAIFTKDQLKMDLNVCCWYQITDTRKAVYNVDDLYQNLEQTILTGLRDATSHLTSFELISSIDDVNTRLYRKLDDVTGEWGLVVKRVEIQEIKAPDAVMSATEEEIRLRRTAEASLKREQAESEAKKLHAEAQRTIALLEARTTNEIQVGRAAAAAEEKQLQAEAEGKYVEQMLAAGASEEYLLQMEHAKAWQALTLNQKVIIVPYEAAKFLGSAQLLQQTRVTGEIDYQ